MPNRAKISKLSYYKQGYINLEVCKKYINFWGTHQPIVYRSMYEYKFIIWCEHNPRVIQWSIEPFAIEYIGIDKQKHKYYPDFYIYLYTNSELKTSMKCVIEIKPKNQTVKPVFESGSKMSSKSKKYSILEWQKNQRKWIAAQQFCDARDMRFIILTENTINKL